MDHVVPEPVGSAGVALEEHDGFTRHSEPQQRAGPGEVGEVGSGGIREVPVGVRPGVAEPAARSCGSTYSTDASMDVIVQESHGRRCP